MKFNNNHFLIYLFLIAFTVISLKYIYHQDDGLINEKKNNKISKLEREKARNNYFFNIMRDPATNSIPKNIRNRELKFAKSLPQKLTNSLGKSAANDFDFFEIGPNDVGGRTRALAIDVTNSNTIMAAGVSGGIWKSTDNGDTWQLKTNKTDATGITSLVQDPRNGFTNIWYATGGEIGNTAADQGRTAPLYGGGLFKSIDNGDLWQLINTANNPTKFDSNFDYTLKLLINPATGSLFMAELGTGIVKSTDEGQSFTTSLGGLNDHFYSDIIVKSDGTLIGILSQIGFDDSTTYAPGIYKSSDDGDTWTDITPAGFPAVHGRSVLGASNLATPIFYILTNTGETLTNGNEDIRLFKLSTDSSVAEDLSGNLPIFESELFTSHGHLFTQSSYNMAIAVKPNDDDFVLIAGTSLFRSTNGFATLLSNKKLNWIGGYHPTEFFYPNLHPDIHNITFDPNNPNRVWIGDDGGLSLAEDITDESYSEFFPWIDKNNGYNVTQFYTVSLPKTADDVRVMGGTQDNGTPYFRWDQVNYETQDVSSGDGAYCYFANKTYCYTSVYKGQIFRFKYNSQNDPEWNSFTVDVTPETAEGQLFVNPFVIDPNPTERYMYYPAGNSLWRNDDIRIQNGTQPLTSKWSEMNDLSMPVDFTITTLAVSQSNPEHVLYYGAYNSVQAPKIYRLENSHTATTGFTDVSIPDAVSGAYIHHIAINPDDANDIIVVFSNYNIVGLYHSLDGGSTYEAIEGNLEGDNTNPGPSIRRALIFPYNNSYIYFLATSTGLYSTTALDGDNTVWQLESPSGLGNVVVEYLDSRTSDNTIAVATHGRGIFLGRPSGTVDVNNKINLPKNFSLSQNYPNPFNPSTKIEFNIAKSDKVDLTVYNSLGEKVITLVNKDLGSGNYSANFNAENLSSGIYYYKLTAGSFVSTKKMILLK